ncbi:hypothetical protein [Natrinema sp. DC36]|uniref:hypothetical protein n=1 Tax=Natrinema sp. DC36 TaxID=2878680 RepID=UPI001CF0BBE1|nr:hypothetical protein [Natrinema sp. DC36]
MKSGSIAISNGSVEEIDSCTNTVDKHGFEAIECIDIRESITDLSGNTLAFKGVAAEQYLKDGKSISISEESDSISVIEGADLAWRYTDLLIIPDDILVLGSSSADFVFEIIRSNFGINFERAEIDLQAYRKTVEDEYSDVEPWKIGFYGREGNADNGVIHGNNLLDDSDIGEILSHNATNQIGLNFSRDGKQMKTFVTESGYVDIYQPSDYESGQFVNYLKEDIRPYLRTDLVL